MPKASLASSKTLKSGFGIQAGCLKVLDARFKIVQHTKKDGVKITPMCVLQWDVTKAEKDGTAVDESQIETKDFIYCWGSKEAGDDGLHKFSFHPANGTAADDMDPEDCGAAIDTEGNTLVPTGNAMGPFEDAEAALICKALELKGFKEELNDQCFAQNYVGLVIEVESMPKGEYCKKIGAKHTPREGAKETVWDVKEVHVFPGKKAAAKGAAASVKGKANGKAAASDDGNELAMETVKKVAESKDFKGKEGIARSKFQAAVMTQLHRDKKSKEQAAVMKLVKDDEWIINAGGELGFMVDTDEQLVSF